MKMLPEDYKKGEFLGYRLDELHDSLENETILYAPVTKCDENLSLYVDLGNGVTGIIPIEEFEYNLSGKEPKYAAVIGRVGKKVAFKIMSIEKDWSTGENYVCMLSRKAAQKECYETYISKLKVGDIIDAEVTHIERYGIFCDIGCGMLALLPIEYFSIVRINKPAKYLKGLHNLKVVVKQIEDGRITLTHKELLGTWKEEAEKFKTGTTVQGTVRLVESYGMFIELTPNLAGLSRVVEGVKEGDTVSVLIKAIVPDKMKVKLNVINTRCCVPVAMQFDYRIPESKHIDRWRYSTENSEKLIETIF